MPNNIERQLKSIKEFIIKSIRGRHEHLQQSMDNPYYDDIDLFLNRLILEKEDHLEKDKFQLRAGRQLLCCIAIDIKNRQVPIQRYIDIFSKINPRDYNVQARHQFMAAIKNNNLFYRDSSVRQTGEYNVIVCPIKDWRYYIDEYELGVTGTAERKWVHDMLMLNAREKKIFLKSKILNKKSALGYFWTTTVADMEDVISHAPDNTKTTQLVDKLGLSHFDFKTVDTQLYFYINLGDVPIATFIPNATIVDWENPWVGFLSNKDREAGRTFPISGFSNLDGLRERVFHVLELSDEQRKLANIMPLNEPVRTGIKMHDDEIVTEGVNRFRARKKKPVNE